MSAPILRLAPFCIWARYICKGIWCRCDRPDGDLLDWDLPEMVPDEGIEPPTFGLQNRCTTTVLIRRAVSAGPSPYYQMTPNVQPSVCAIWASSAAGFHNAASCATRRNQAHVKIASVAWSL